MDPDEQDDEFPDPGIVADIEDFPLDGGMTIEDELEAGIERY